MNIKNQSKSKDKESANYSYLDINSLPNIVTVNIQISQK